MTFDLVPTQGEGVLSVSLLVQRRREMAYPVLTKAFPQPNTTDTMCCHHGVIALTKKASTRVFILIIYCDCINSEYSETLALIKTLLESKYGVACCYGNVEPRGSHQDWVLHAYGSLHKYIWLHKIYWQNRTQNYVLYTNVPR